MAATFKQKRTHGTRLDWQDTVRTSSANQKGCAEDFNVENQGCGELIMKQLHFTGSGRAEVEAAKAVSKSTASLVLGFLQDNLFSKLRFESG